MGSTSTAPSDSRTSVIFGTVLALFLSSMPQVALAELSQEEANRAARALADGADLQHDGRCEEAIRVWRGALRWTGHWAFPNRIALCLESLGQFQEAEIYLQRGRALGWDELEADAQPEFLRVFDRVRARLPALLVITSNVGDAHVAVDGESVGTLPMRRPIELSPGRHVVEVSANGHESSERELQLAAGARVFETFTLARDERRAASEPLDEGSSRRRSRMRLWSILFAGVGIALAGVGGWLMSIDDDREGQHAYDTLGLGVTSLSLGTGLVAGALAILIRPPGGEGE